MPEVPYVCLRIPTGGGKTLVGGLAIERINRHLLHTDSSLTLWLVPTETIQTQTIRDLKSSGSILRTMMGAKLGSYELIEIDEATSIQTSTLTGSNVILVVEHKGNDRYDHPEEIGKRILGALWEKRSLGRCLFVMTRGERFKEMIMEKIK